MSPESFVNYEGSKLVEPSALGGFTSSSLDAKRHVDALLSIAISLKRIADAMERETITGDAVETVVTRC